MEQIISFKGQAVEAIKYYQKAFGAEVIKSSLAGSVIDKFGVHWGVMSEYQG